MLSPFTVLQTEAQPAAVIHVTCPSDQIQTFMGPAIAEVIAAARSQGVGPAGPVFAHHFDMTPGIFNFEVGVPVSAALRPVGRAKPGELPAAKVVRTLYTGPYEGLGQAWSQFMDQIEAAGHQPAANLWERYITDPNRTDDDSQFETELNRPIL